MQKEKKEKEKERRKRVGKTRREPFTPSHLVPVEMSKLKSAVESPHTILWLEVTDMGEI